MGMDPNNLNKPPNKKKNKEGEVSIDKTPKKDRKGSMDNMGEYVDFEEIED